MPNTQERSGRRGVSYSDSGLNSGKSYVSGSGSLTDPQVKSHWDSSRSNYKSKPKPLSSSEVLANSRELMKKYLADRNTTNTEVGIVPGLNKQSELRSSYKPSIKLATTMSNGDMLDFEDLNSSIGQSKVNLKGNGEGDHWPFSFSYKGLKTKRDDQNAYRQELDRQIQHKKLIREQETEHLKRISRQKNSDSGLCSGKSKSGKRLPWLSKSEEVSSNSSREMKPSVKTSNPESQLNDPVEPMFFANNQNPSITPNPGSQTVDPNLNVPQSLNIQNIPNQMLSPIQSVPNFINFANLPPNQFQHPQPQFGLVKDMNTGIFYQQIASPMINPQPFSYYPAQQPVNPPQPHANDGNMAAIESSCPDNSNVNVTDQGCQGREEILENESSSFGKDEKDFNTLDTMNSYRLTTNTNAGYKAAGGDYKPHVSESSVQRPESAILRTNQKLILDRQIEEKRRLEKQKKEQEFEQELLLQKKIKLYQDKMQLELQQEQQKQKELEEAKRIKQEMAFQKEEELRKETEERRKREKEERRKGLMALAAQEEEFQKMNQSENNSFETDGKITHEMEAVIEDDRPLPAPLRFREVSTQSTESSSNESICICGSANQGSLCRNESVPSSAVTLHSIPEIEECQIEVEVEPLLVDFTAALALEADRMKKLLNSLDSKQKIMQL